ncbi:NUDIX domain-containing protein [Nocardia pseudovaccinii]|uniref:NUDIX domain-containing protein n=1 Tax=Nocardia pseudovaccinii TaxID=189540 RepID=UPI003D8D424B
MADRHLIDVHVLLTDGDRLLLTQRRGNDAFAGRWHLPSGKLDADEPITARRPCSHARCSFVDLPSLDRRNP